MTPRIVKSEEDVELLKQAEAARMSWCLNDVLELHEDVAFRPRDGHWGDDETDTIYPDGDPGVEGLDSLKYVPLEPSAQPTEAPLPEASKDARRAAPRLRTQPETSGYVAPANYETRTGPAKTSSNGVYPATGTYGSAAPVYPATSTYRSTTGY